MRVNRLKIHAVLTFVIVFLAFPSLLHPADLKIKAVVLNGDPAPEGGTFTNFTRFSMNNPGAIAFIGFSSTGGGIYLASDGGIQRIIKSGDVVNVPEFILTPPPTEILPSVDPNVFVYRFADGHQFVCHKTWEVTGFDSGFGTLFMNDSFDLLFAGGLSPNPPFSILPILFSGGVLTDLIGCPGLPHSIFDLTGPVFFNIFSSVITSPLNNAGAFVLDIGTFGFGRGEGPFLFSGGTPAPLNLQDSSVIDINDSGALLIESPQGIFLDSTPVALVGGPAGQGKTFTGFLPAVNNKGEVVFIGILNDFSSAIFHWANGTLTPLVRQGDPSPTGGRFTRFFSVQLNDNGEVAFHAEIGSPSGIFHVSAKGGGVSKIVFPGDAAPGGEIFTGVGEYQLNNKGQVAFLGVLSNGRFGLFLASSAGLETEFVDPVPDLLAGAAVTSDPTNLANIGRLVTGIAADGTAQVVVRVKTGQAGTVQFSLVDQGGALLPPSNFNGFLSQVGQTVGSGTVSVPAADVKGVGSMAFAAFHAPMDFASGPNAFESGQSERKVSIRIRLTTSAGETVETTKSLRVVRPPVVLVHGLWGSENSWDDFRPLATSSNFFVRRINYRGTHAARIAANAPHVLNDIKLFVKEYKTVAEVAAVRADLVTHSMGGLLVRTLPLLGSAFFRNDNYQQGDVHKLINIATPHFGSGLARFLLQSPCVSQVFTNRGFPTDQGAVEDLVPNSPALNQINGVATALPLHQIIGLASDEEIRDSEGSAGMLWLRLLKCRRDFNGIPSGAFFGTVLRTVEHDLIVPAASQRGGAGSNFTPFSEVIHTRVSFLLVGIGEPESQAISQRVIGLLNSPIALPDFVPFSAAAGGL